MTKGTRKIASKTPQEVDERETPSLLKRPHLGDRGIVVPVDDAAAARPPPPAKAAGAAAMLMGATTHGH